MSIAWPQPSDLTWWLDFFATPSALVTVSPRGWPGRTFGPGFVRPWANNAACSAAVRRPAVTTMGNPSTSMARWIWSAFATKSGWTPLNLLEAIDHADGSQEQREHAQDRGPADAARLRLEHSDTLGIGIGLA